MKTLFKIVLADKTSLLVVADNTQSAEDAVAELYGTEVSIKTTTHVAKEVEQFEDITSTRCLIITK